MGKGIFVLGTDTDVGKTIVTAGIVYNLNKAGFKTCSFKAASSGGCGDIDLINEMSNITKTSSMNPYSFTEPVSPHLASKLEDIQIDKNILIDSYKKLIREYDYVICEGSGGVIVPIIDDQYFIYDLVKDLDLDVVLVAKANVGTINHTSLTLNFMKSLGINVKGIIFNLYNGEFYEDDNIKMIEKINNINTIEVLDKLEDTSIQNLKSYFNEKLDSDKLLTLFK